MFNAGAERLCKVIGDPGGTIYGRFFSGAFSPNNRRAVQAIKKKDGRQNPSAQEIVFGPVPFDGGSGFAINEKHVVTLPTSHPDSGRGHRDSHEMSAARCVDPDVIVLASRLVFPSTLGSPLLFQSGVQPCLLALPELRVEVKSSGRKRL